MHVCKIVLSHSFHYQRVSVTVVTIIRVTYMNIRNLNRLSKCINEALDITRNVIVQKVGGIPYNIERFSCAY
jgi:hypothetical protein